MKGNVKTIQPAKLGMVDDMRMLQKELGVDRMAAMMYRKVSV